MKPVRVLIVDDSAVIRKVLSGLLAADPAIVVAGTAGNGEQALARIPDVKPDLITLDIEMPGMNGLETLVQIRKLYPKLPVIMFSTLTERGAAATLDALARGASDYVTKPSHSEGSETSRERVRDELIRKIKSWCAVRVPVRTLPVPVVATVASPSSTTSRIDLVAIGTSTGGPNALTTLIPQFPADFPVPIVIVQHMPPLFTRLLAERLHTLARLEVREGKEGEKLERGQIWIAPGDYHMTVNRKGPEFVLGLNRDAQENSCRPAVDVLFRSVGAQLRRQHAGRCVDRYGSRWYTWGRGSARGGGEVIVQDELSSVVWGMPGSIVAAGLAHRVCSLSDIGPEVVRRVAQQRTMASVAH